MRVHIDLDRCQGHGRCYDLAPDIFGEDEEGYGFVIVEGAIPPERERDAHIATLNCPEDAITVTEER